MKKVFAVLNQMVSDGAIENYAIAGAVGAMFYIEPFSTQDIDVMTIMPGTPGKLTTEIPGWDYLKRHGYREIRGEGIIIEEWPVQFLPVFDVLEREAYLNAETQDYEGLPVRVVLAEHLVAIMLKLGRLKDLARVEMFLSQNAVDREVLQELVKRHGLKEKWDDFEKRSSS